MDDGRDPVAVPVANSGKTGFDAFVRRDIDADTFGFGRRVWPAFPVKADDAEAARQTFDHRAADEAAASRDDHDVSPRAIHNWHAPPLGDPILRPGLALFTPCNGSATTALKLGSIGFLEKGQ